MGREVGRKINVRMGRKGWREEKEAGKGWREGRKEEGRAGGQGRME